MKVLCSLALFVATASAQYTWHTTTTTFPPPSSSWLNMAPHHPGGYLVNQGMIGGGEVRSTFGNLQPGDYVQLKHYLGMHMQPNDWWNPQFYWHTGIFVTLTGVVGQGHWTVTVTEQWIHDYYGPNIAHTQLGSYTIPAPSSGQHFSTSYRAGGINIRIGNSAVFQPTALSPQHFYGFERLFGPITEVRVGNLDTVAPNPITGLSSSISNGIATISWNPTTDNTNGIGDIRYEVFRGNQSQGTTHLTTWTLPCGPGDSFNVTVRAYDGHRNFNAGATIAVSSPPVSSGLVDDSRRVGIHARAPHWGAMGETIDTRSMNLNYTIPLLKAQGRNGLGLGISLTYNSQNWRQENSTITKPGADVGYGFGWKLLAGSLIPVFSTPTQLAYYLFTDSTGAEYKLDVNSSGIWSSKEGLAVFYDPNLYRLYFADGSFWRMESVSGSSEQDAGTRYPTTIQDRHGNQILITYRPAIGGFTPNQSARIQKIDDIRSTQASNWTTFSFAYNTDAIPHLTTITNNINTGESYTLNYTANQALYEPFANSQQFGSAVRLASLVQNGVNLTTAFDYGPGAELQKVTLPLGGEFLWNYGTQSYAGNRSIREVRSRNLRPSPGAALINYAFSHPSGDSSLKYHSQTTLADPSGIGQRRWNFLTASDYRQGLLNTYEELDNWNVRSRSENVWTDIGGGWPKLAESISTLDVGLSTQQQQRTTFLSNNYGIVRGRTVYAVNAPATPLRTERCIMTETISPYPTRFILNVPTYCDVVENGVTVITLNATLDGYWTNGFIMAGFQQAVRLWENPNTLARALISSLTDGYSFRYAQYNVAGQPISGNDGQGFSTSVTYGGVGGSTVPVGTAINGNSGLGSSMTWNGFLGLTMVSGGQGTEYFGYDSFARPNSATGRFGATTSMAYNSSARTVTATINGRFTRQIHDGLGRVTRVESGVSGTVHTIVDTEYEPCACSPVGKLKRTSLPYAPGGTVRWTVYTYDGLGRTLTVAQPNNSGTTTYLYEGNTVRVTSPSGRWKKYVMDGLGRLAQVIEPRPAGGEYTTSYTYNLNGKLTQVSMPRDGTTQTRTFTYDTVLHSRLVSSTNPENGTVSYTYNPDGTVATKTDAKNIRTEFSYDAYKRPTEMRKLTLSGGVWTEDRCQRVSYDYTLNGLPTRFLQKVTWGWNNSNQPCNNAAGAFSELYAYGVAGSISSKTLVIHRVIWGTLQSAQLQASWTYNNEGQTTGITYPARSDGSHAINSAATYTYDTMGRSSGVSWLSLGYQHNPPSTPIVSSVTYNAFGAVTGFNHLGQTETRQYNDLGQLTRITQGTAIDIEYRFSATANDGKITSQKNWRTGEDVTYQYDQLERLISASTTAGPQSWGLSWSYDGFGNRLAQTVTQGSGPAHSVLVNASTNRISSAGFSYDPNGNLTAMPQTGGGTLNLTYDLSNRVTNLAHNGWSEDYLYSPDNRRIWRSAGQTFCGASIDNNQGLSWNPGTGVQSQYILYSPAGQKLGVYCLRFSPNGHYNVWTASEENVYWGSRLVGKRIGISAMSHFITDRLHSKGDGSAYYPYGESKMGAAGDDREQFATYTRDQSSGLDYADQRWYSSRLGRFLTVDPAADGDNHYAYVDGDPIGSIDPTGLWSHRIPLAVDTTCVAPPNGPFPTNGWGSGGWSLFKDRCNPTEYVLRELEMTKEREGSDLNQRLRISAPEWHCGVNPVTGSPGISTVQSGQPGELRPGHGGGGRFGAYRARESCDMSRPETCHQGIDIAGVPGSTSVVSALAGTVTRIENIAHPGFRGGEYGNVVFVDLGGGYEARYAHLATISANLAVGQAIGQGDEIGVLGQTGNAKGQRISEAHLHFEIRVNGRPVDPVRFLNQPCSIPQNR